MRNLFQDVGHARALEAVLPFADGREYLYWFLQRFILAELPCGSNDLRRSRTQEGVGRQLIGK